MNIDQIIRNTRQKYSYLDNRRNSSNKDALAQMRSEFNNSKQQLTNEASGEKINLPSIHRNKVSISTTSKK